MAGERLRNLAEILKQFQEFLPLIVQVMDCFKALTPEAQRATLELVAGRIEGTDDEKQEFKAQVMRIVA